MTRRDLYGALGEMIREERVHRKMTQADLAKVVGISRAAIANIEAGNQGLSLHRFYNIALALGWDPREMILFFKNFTP
jgi:UDP-N-acetylglucosamine 1-carboxyvinyltransferase